MRREIHQSVTCLAGDLFPQDAQHSRAARVASSEAPSETGSESPESSDPLCHDAALSGWRARGSLDRSAESGSDCQTSSQRDTKTSAPGGTAPGEKVMAIDKGGQAGR